MADLEEDLRLFADESLELAKLVAPIALETWPEWGAGGTGHWPERT